MPTFKEAKERAERENTEAVRAFRKRLNRYSYIAIAVVWIVGLTWLVIDWWLHA